jgi:hypothetical protein
MGLALATMSLNACATTKTKRVTEKEYICPEIEPWDAEMRERAADDLQFLPPSSPVFDLLASSYRLRDSVKAGCEKAKELGVEAAGS